ncbi:MAG: glycosyltransferase family 4 protein [Clostridiales bacterium]|nr:glycosyltransferase family 4 protein [Clostridiales bacterium]
MIGHKRIPTRSGGVEVVVEELSTRMAEKGNDVVVYNRHCKEEKINSYRNVKIVEVKTFERSSLNALVYSFFATIKCIFKKYDVIHFHAEGPCAMIPIAKLFGKKVVATIHGLDWQRSKWGGFASKYIMFGEKMAAKHADKVIVLSKNVKKYFKDTYGCEAVIIPNGINRVKREDAEIIKSKYGLVKDSYILFLARITPEKGLDYLIDAYKSLNTDKKLVIAGSINPETEYIRSFLEKAKGTKDIIFTDFVSGKTLAELFSNCYVYVLPSDIEGMPMSLLEAVGYGAGVIVSDIAENTDCLDGYGNSFKHGDTQSLKEVLNYCLEHSELKDCDFKAGITPSDVEKKREELSAKYDWDNITDLTLGIYKSVQNKKYSEK